jgi:CBS domain-containing protein
MSAAVKARVDFDHNPARPLIVADIARWPALRIDPECPSEEAFARMQETGVRHLLVTLGRAPLGVVCDLDAAESPHLAVAEIASRPRLISLWASAADAAYELRDAVACALVVRVPGRPCGILTRGDLTRAGVCGPWPRCESCGSTHHVRSHASAGVAFCAECLDGSQLTELDELDELYVDLGVVD